MKTRQILTATAIAAAMTVAVSTAFAADAPATEKCYGVAKAASNDCATAAHGCAGGATKAADPAEWLNVPAGLCDKLVGGSLKAPAAADKPMDDKMMQKK